MTFADNEPKRKHPCADELARRDAEVLALQDENVVLRARLDALAARLEKIDGQKEVLEDGTK